MVLLGSISQQHINRILLFTWSCSPKPTLALLAVSGDTTTYSLYDAAVCIYILYIRTYIARVCGFGHVRAHTHAGRQVGGRREAWLGVEDGMMECLPHQVRAHA